MEQVETVGLRRRGGMPVRRLALSLWAFLARPSGQFSLGLLVLVGGLAGVVAWAGFGWGLEATSSETFCRGCHEMEQTVYMEYRTSVHDQNRTGVRATCPDCHVPHDFPHKMLRKIQASSEVFHHLMGDIDTPETFEAHRLDLAEHVWTTMKETDSRECRSCHKFDQMDLMRQNDRARDSHSRAAAEGRTCIDCHKGIAHRLPAGAIEAERDLDAQWRASHDGDRARKDE